MKNRNGDLQLLVDISTLAETDAKTGIQRVVRSILLELLNNPPKGFSVEPVYYVRSEGFYYARNFTQKFLDVAGVEIKGNDEGKLIEKDERISFKTGDVFLGLDLTAQFFPEIDTTLELLKNSGVAINYVIYDLTPIINKEMHAEGMVTVFAYWIDSIVKYSSKLICISDAVATDVREWLKDKAYKQIPSIDFFHLGADIKSSKPSVGMPSNANSILSKLETRPSFLMVGTIEPRKGVAQVVSAFELLWQKGTDVNLVIVGKEGWMVDDIVHSIQNNLEYENRLIWLKGISDEYLEKVYSSSDALIAASSAEGFGLPLIEAAIHNTSIIARNLAVFKEVAGPHAFYFDGTSAASLADSVVSWLTLAENNNIPTVEGMNWLTWKESSAKLLNRIGLSSVYLHL
jgi:glycosyltransferase involved in cell wall biosynthesis